MARTFFHDILSAYTVDIKNEIKKLYDLFFLRQFRLKRTRISIEPVTLWKMCSESFLTYEHRKTIISLNEFDNTFGFNRFYDINKCPNGEELDYLIDFCEYVYNLLKNIKFQYEEAISYSEFLIKHIEELCTSMNYVIHDDGNGIYYLVSSNVILDFVCEKIEKDVTQLIRIYSHKNTKGDLAKKQQILSALCKDLEPNRNELGNLNMKKITENVFSGANKCNVRHNNTNQEGKNYCSNFAELSLDEMESIYDNIFENIIVLLSVKMESESIKVLDNKMAKINKKIVPKKE